MKIFEDYRLRGQHDSKLEKQSNGVVKYVILMRVLKKATNNFNDITER